MSNEQQGHRPEHSRNVAANGRPVVEALCLSYNYTTYDSLLLYTYPQCKCRVERELDLAFLVFDLIA